MRRDTIIMLSVTFLLGMAVGAAITWGLGLLDQTQVQVVEGYAYVNSDGTGLGLSKEQGQPGKGYTLMGTLWREQGGPWQDEHPTCLKPLTSDQKVRLGVLQVKPARDIPGREVVVWMECLE